MEELNKMPLNIQLFADAGEGEAGKTSATGEPKPGEGDATTYTEEQVQALLQTESDKRVTEALKKAERTKNKELAEANKLAKMSEAEKKVHALEVREQQVADKETQLALMENKNEASKILAEKGISLELVDFIVADEAEAMMSNITVLDTAFKASVKAEVEKRLTGKTPKDNLSGDTPVTKDTFAKLSLAEMQKISVENPTLFNSLTKK